MSQTGQFLFIVFSVKVKKQKSETSHEQIFEEKLHAQFSRANDKFQA